MRQGHNNNNNKRMRGRNRKGPNPLTRSFESNGPDVKIRGTALHIAEKYITLARDAASSGDRVAEQNYLQHAEHYYRIVAAAQAQMPQQQPMHRADDFDDEDEAEDRGAIGGGGYDRQPQMENRAPQFGLTDPQPYVNGNGFNGHREMTAEDGDADEGEGEEGVSPDQPMERRREANPGEQGREGEGHYRQRGRRSGRGRRRPEGGQQDFGQGAQPMAGPVTVPVAED